MGVFSFATAVWGCTKEREDGLTRTHLPSAYTPARALCRVYALSSAIPFPRVFAFNAEVKWLFPYLSVSYLMKCLGECPRICKSQCTRINTDTETLIFAEAEQAREVDNPWYRLCRHENGRRPHVREAKIGIEVVTLVLPHIKTDRGGCGGRALQISLRSQNRHADIHFQTSSPFC
ncbi:hypothetical protein VPH35_138248 [Triticum aestivum]|uniref:Uncharacterized protein n=1 Tax=Aegilops tauschii TaxID=37682 RepID=M8ASY8_AEGTA